MLLFSLLLSAASVACISAQSPFDDPFLEKLWEEFKERNNIKGNADIDFQTIRNGASFMKLGEKWTSLLAKDLEAVDILAPGASMIVDGTAKVPQQMVFTSKSRDDVLITKDMATGKVLSASATRDDGTVENIVPVDSDSETFATVIVDDLDEGKLSEYILDEAIVPPQGNRRLRFAGAGQHTKRDPRVMQASCSDFNVIEMSVVVDSIFCAALGGQVRAQARVQSIVALASQYYEVPGLCVKLQIRDQIYFCNGNDPTLTLANGNTGCSSFLGAFASFVAAEAIPGDVVHLFHGRDLSGNTIGCAYLNTLCNTNGFSSGVNEMTFSSIESVQAQLLAHENGVSIPFLSWFFSHAKTSTFAMLIT